MNENEVEFLPEVWVQQTEAQYHNYTHGESWLVCGMRWRTLPRPYPGVKIIPRCDLFSMEDIELPRDRESLSKLISHAVAIKVVRLEEITNQPKFPNIRICKVAGFLSWVRGDMEDYGYNEGLAKAVLKYSYLCCGMPTNPDILVDIRGAI